MRTILRSRGHGWEVIGVAEEDAGPTLVVVAVKLIEREWLSAGLDWGWGPYFRKWVGRCAEGEGSSYVCPCGDWGNCKLLEDWLLGWPTGRALRASKGLVIVPS